MTDTHSIAQPFEAEVSPANNRQLTVSYASRYPDYSRIPAITLKGQWLEAAGFATGTAVDVKVMEGCIVLTAQPPAAEESKLMQSLRQVCKLSARKQKQVQEFIGVISSKTPRYDFSPLPHTEGEFSRSLHILPCVTQYPSTAHHSSAVTRAGSAFSATVSSPPARVVRCQ